MAKFSKAFSEKLDNLKNKGYEPISADIAYIVAWQAKRMRMSQLSFANFTSQKTQ